jgi:hypothetical protein
MSVGFFRAVADGCRAYGVSVTFEPGCEARGNGQVFSGGRPQGLLLHHTGSNYGTGLSVLLQGRSDLSPPLCNSSGYPDGRIHFIAAHPANHAGASGGKSMGPLPVSRTFNKVVWGHEIMYPGTKPMTPQQERSAIILGAVISKLLGRPTADWVRSHFETSITGKWDMGLGEGTRSVNMNAFRAKITAVMQAGPSVLGATAVPQAEEDDDLQQFIIKPEGGLPLAARIVVNCPTADLAASKRKAWLSVTALDLRGAAWVQVFAQGASAGTGQWRWTEKEMTVRQDNSLPRTNKEVPPNTSHLIISWDFTKCPEGATLTLETKPMA